MILFAPGDPRPIHFMGIGGAGMSALGLLAKQQGVAITGCDTDPSGAADLAALGVRIWRGHDPGHLDGARAVVITAAIAPEQPELERARTLGIPVVRRADPPGQGLAGGTGAAGGGGPGKTPPPATVDGAPPAPPAGPPRAAGGPRAGGGGRPRRLRVPGMHTVRSAAGALAATHALGADVDAAARALAEFAGVARRFERLGDAGGVTVVDDYAHHPTEVGATLAAARQAFPGRRLVAVFQPHLYSRTQLHGEAFGRALGAADVVVGAPVVGARRQPRPGLTAECVCAGATRAGG